MAHLHLQVENVSDSLLDRLRCFAHETNRTVRAVALAAVGREEAWEWRERLARRSETDLGLAPPSDRVASGIRT